jgi:hypothetical protein
MTRIWNWIKNNWLLALTIIWLTIGLALIIIYLFLFGKVNWQVLTGFATWVLAGGVFLAFWQIREARKSTNAQIAMNLFRELRNDKTLGKVRYIYSLQPNEDGKCITEKHKHDIDYVLDRLDILSILVDEGIVDKRIAIDGYAGVTTLRCWYVLHQYIWQVRKERKYFSENVEAFTNLCLEYFYNNRIKVGLEYKPHKTVEDLISELRKAKKETDPKKKKLYPRSKHEIKSERNCK